MTTIIDRKQAPDSFDNGDEELIFINRKKDVFTVKTVLGPASAEFYKEKIIRDLLEQVLKHIEPEYVEKNGFELVTYKLIIKKYKS